MFSSSQLSHKVSPKASPRVGRSSLKDQICLYKPKTEACKKYVGIPMLGGEEKHVHMYMATNIAL